MGDRVRERLVGVAQGNTASLHLLQTAVVPEALLTMRIRYATRATHLGRRGAHSHFTSIVIDTFVVSTRGSSRGHRERRVCCHLVVVLASFGVLVA